MADNTHIAKELTQTSKFILYTSLNGDIKLDVFIRDENPLVNSKNDGRTV